jgi:hypothetical protein
MLDTCDELAKRAATSCHIYSNFREFEVGAPKLELYCCTQVSMDSYKILQKSNRECYDRYTFYVVRRKSSFRIRGASVKGENQCLGDRLYPRPKLIGIIKGFSAGRNYHLPLLLYSIEVFQDPRAEGCDTAQSIFCYAPESPYSMNLSQEHCKLRYLTSSNILPTISSTPLYV